MEILANSAQVTETINGMASAIIKKYTEQDHPLFVCLLKGANPFSSMLMFAITEQDPTFRPELEYLSLSTYQDERTAKLTQVAADLPIKSPIRGRKVLVLDDVLDNGLTAEFAKNHLLNRGATKVGLAVLVEKSIERNPDNTSFIHADFVGFYGPEKWLVGMGMDDTSQGYEGSRWLNYIGIV